MNIGWPEGIMLALLFLSLCVSISRHGTPRRTNYDAGAALFTIALDVGLLWWGGFFA